MAKGTPDGSAAEPITRDQAVRQGYASAQKQLRERHLDEFHKLQAEAIKALGFEWSPRPDEEGKAKAEIESLLDKYPNLRELLTQGQETPAGAPPGGEPLPSEGDTVVEKGL